MSRGAGYRSRSLSRSASLMEASSASAGREPTTVLCRPNCTLGTSKLYLRVFQLALADQAPGAKEIEKHINT
jgi:hypothetical protein